MIAVGTMGRSTITITADAATTSTSITGCAISTTCRSQSAAHTLSACRPRPGHEWSDVPLSLLVGVIAAGRATDR